MNKFRIVPLAADYAQRIRDNKKDDFGHAVIEETANGLGPCRVSLKPFKRRIDKRILFTHSPFETDNVYNQPGPVFINAAVVEPYSDVHNFPKEIKADKEHFHLTLIGYNKDQMMIFTRLAGEEDIDVLINTIFSEHEHIAYLHARSAEACCYICKIERV